ncbi:putative receptor-like protein kinase At3g47110 [Camellia sinensis]|uniref:putative receptor-like protein kinase At3g47110 n=1 Tax=Camellia sinensis TaxID=4442 RepID=UPI0010366D69|nr:putative receptor-like protein kinase At3g47110 [Camellia sinensis]
MADSRSKGFRERKSSKSNTKKITHTLSLRNNSLVNKIPLELGRLWRLQELSFLNNSISGEIPANISACSNLISFELPGNTLTGKILVELGSLSKLNALYIGRNNITGDLGLARFLPEDIYNSSAIQPISIGFRGSIGYVAPEYGIGNEVLTFGDVYSYGILLLEMFTRKRPTDSMFNDGLSLHSFVKMALPELVATVADPTLLQQREMGQASSSTNNTRNQSSHTSHKIHECLISIFNIGIACSQEAPRNRPTISHVVTQLHAIKNNLIGKDGDHGSRRARIAV